MREGTGKKIEEFIRIMAALRAPDGCPWDKEQTHSSLTPYLLEEAGEVVEAIEKNDMTLLREELGDVLLQVVFHAQLAEERGDFDLYDVAEEVSNKIVERHPHVFDKEREGAEITDAVAVKNAWEKQKKEKKQRDSILEGIPKQMPTLLRARRFTEKASTVGFDWDNISGAWEKVQEELAELKVHVDSKTPDRDEAEHELGDVLFALVNLSRFMHNDPESALRKSIHRFVERFHYIERSLKASGKQLDDVSLEEMDKLWNEAKQLESKS